MTPQKGCQPPTARTRQPHRTLPSLPRSLGDLPLSERVTVKHRADASTATEDTRDSTVPKTNSSSVRKEITSSGHTAAHSIGNHCGLRAYIGDLMGLGCPVPAGSAAPQSSAMHAESGFFTMGRPQQPNMENCTEGDSMWNGIVLFQFIIYIPGLSLGIPLNDSFWTFSYQLKRWTKTMYMNNLVVADSSLLFALPFLIYFTKYEHPIDNLCFTIQRIYFTNMPMSILIITLIAIDRYIAIKFPLKAKILRSPLKSASICGALWIILMIFSYLRPQLPNKKEKVCFRKQSTQPRYTLVASFTFGYFIPLLIVTFCSVQVIKSLKKMVTSPHERKLIQEAIHIISVSLCVFTICFSPLCIALLLAVDVAGACSLLSKVRACAQICACLANSNCCLDALSMFAAKEFQHFHSLFPTCLSMRRKMNPSQESRSPTDQVMT
ncbi:LOW QUALITY PROTEIN: G-protein coupled receptor 35-like [Guaruba guarouba]